MTFGVCEQKNPWNYPTTSPCVLDENGNILTGLCSEETKEKLLLRKKCLHVYLRQRFFVRFTLYYLVTNMCAFETTNRMLDKRTRNSTTERVPPYLFVDYQPDGIISSYTPYGKQEIDFRIS